MGVFIIWSGENSSSHKLAKALHQWTPNVIQHVNYYVFSQDIYPPGGRTTPDHCVCRITDKRKLEMKFHLSPTEEYSENHWQSETGIWTIDIWNGKNAPREGWPATLKSCRWVIELCYDGQRYNDPRWGNDRCCSFGSVGFFSLDQTMEAFVLLEKVLSVIPETVDPTKINGLFNAVSADRYTRRDEEVWLPVLIALADLVEILQSSPEEHKQPDKNLL